VKKNGLRSYQAPGALVAVFYLFLIVWTFAAVPPVIARATRSEAGDILQLIMIIGIFSFTWYFSLGVFYRIRQEADGSIELSGVRKTQTVHPRDIKTVEGPFLPIGFVRFKSGREKLYLLCSIKNPDLQAILKHIGEINPNIRFKTR
jgi:hypothetical protein